VTERDRVYGWLGHQTSDKSVGTSGVNDPRTADADWSSASLLSVSKLSHTVAYLSLQVATKLRADALLHEAYDAYRYALQIFEDYPPGVCLYVQV